MPSTQKDRRPLSSLWHTSQCQMNIPPISHSLSHGPFSDLMQLSSLGAASASRTISVDYKSSARGTRDYQTDESNSKESLSHFAAFGVLTSSKGATTHKRGLMSREKNEQKLLGDRRLFKRIKSENTQENDQNVENCRQNGYADFDISKTSSNSYDTIKLSSNSMSTPDYECINQNTNYKCTPTLFQNESVPSRLTSSPVPAVVTPTKKKEKLLDRIPIWIEDRTAYYSKDYGIDNSHHNFWSANSFEQEAAKADPEHPGNYVLDFPRLSGVDRMRIITQLGCFADHLHDHPPRSSQQCLCHVSNLKVGCTKSLALLGLACQIFDRFMVIVKKHDEIYKDSPKHVLYSMIPKKISHSPEAHMLLNQLIAIVCYAIADRHDSTKYADYSRLFVAWTSKIDALKLFSSHVAKKLEYFLQLEFRILGTLKAHVSLPTTSSLVENLLCCRNANTPWPPRHSSKKLEPHSIEAQILIRLASANYRIGLMYKPSVQAQAALGLVQSSENLTLSQDSNVNQCQLQMVKFFIRLLVGNINKSTQEYQKTAIVTLTDHESGLSRWLKSLFLNKALREITRGMKRRYDCFSTLMCSRT